MIAVVWLTPALRDVVELLWLKLKLLAEAPTSPAAGPAQPMFDYRYHALSLAAVLFALALGVLIGVAIGDSNLVSSAKNGIVHNLNSEVSERANQTGQLQDKLTDEEAFTDRPLPARGPRTAQPGAASGWSSSAALRPGQRPRARPPSRGGRQRSRPSCAVREPLDLQASTRRPPARTTPRSTSSEPLIERFGELAGRQLVSGGQLVDRELLSRVRASLLSAFDGQLDAPGRARRDARRADRHERRPERSRAPRSRPACSPASAPRACRPSASS